MKTSRRSYNIAENENFWFLSNIIGIRTGLARKNQSVGFEVVAAVVKKNCVFWDITPCSPLKVIQHFGGTCQLHHQGRGISPARNQLESR
jgi:hypothetical protein